MARVYKGKEYILVDVVFDDNFIYDILEDKSGNRVKVISGYID